MKIQLKSDLHEEFTRRYSDGIKDSFKADKAIYDPWRIHPQTEVLVLAGDITVATDRNIEDLKKRLFAIDLPIIYIPGNHEYYGLNMDEVNKKLAEVFKDTNVHFFTNDWINIDNIIFVCSTLWTSLINTRAVGLRHGWSDFRYIEGMDINRWQTMHTNGVSKITEILKFETFKDLKKVVVTHHLPSFKSTPEQFIGDPYNPFFSTNLDGLIEEYKPNLWLHGHTHDSFDYKIGDTRVVCNPYGYFPKAVNKMYNRELLLEI